MTSIDFSKGGYSGDGTEEAFKDFTQKRVPHLWHFREILRTNDKINSSWKKADGSTLSDDEYRELISVSLLNYAVFTSIGEAIVNLQSLSDTLNKDGISEGFRVFEARRIWKSFYSGLYTALNSLSNIIYVLISGKSPLGDDSTKPWNYTPNKAFALTQGKGLNSLSVPIDRCRKRLEIRDHLDHYWTIWVEIRKGTFLMDGDFQKGRVVLRPNSELTNKIDALKLAGDDLTGCAADFELIYEELSKSKRFLDQYLQSKGWTVDYSDYGPPHNGNRPMP